MRSCASSLTSTAMPVTPTSSAKGWTGRSECTRATSAQPSSTLPTATGSERGSSGSRVRGVAAADSLGRLLTCTQDVPGSRFGALQLAYSWAAMPL